MRCGRTTTGSGRGLARISPPRASANSTRSPLRMSSKLRIGLEFFDRRAFRPRGSAAGREGHDVCRHAIPERPVRLSISRKTTTRCDFKYRPGRESWGGGAASPAATRRIEAPSMPKERSSTTCWMGAQSRSTRRPARKCGKLRWLDLSRGETHHHGTSSRGRSRIRRSSGGSTESSRLVQGALTWRPGSLFGKRATWVLDSAVWRGPAFSNHSMTTAPSLG